jgi:hypothetical protein
VQNTVQTSETAKAVDTGSLLMEVKAKLDKLEADVASLKAKDPEEEDDAENEEVCASCAEKRKLAPLIRSWGDVKAKELVDKFGLEKALEFVPSSEAKSNGADPASGKKPEDEYPYPEKKPEEKVKPEDDKEKYPPLEEKQFQTIMDSLKSAVEVKVAEGITKALNLGGKRSPAVPNVPVVPKIPDKSPLLKASKPTDISLRDLHKMSWSEIEAARFEAGV